MKTTIFYENSCGFMAQWSGEILKITDTSIDIKFSANKALRFDLKANSGFMVVTTKKVKNIGVSILDNKTAVSGDEAIREQVLKCCVGNIKFHWNGSKFI